MDFLTPENLQLAGLATVSVLLIISDYRKTKDFNESLKLFNGTLDNHFHYLSGFLEEVVGEKKASEIKLKIERRKKLNG